MFFTRKCHFDIFRFFPNEIHISENLRKCLQVKSSHRKKNISQKTTKINPLNWPCTRQTTFQTISYDKNWSLLHLIWKFEGRWYWKTKFCIGFLPRNSNRRILEFVFLTPSLLTTRAGGSSTLYSHLDTSLIFARKKNAKGQN